MAYSRLHALGLLLGVFLLAACGNAASQATSPSPGASATRPAVPTAAPASTVPATAAPQPSAAPDTLASIPESTTPEGYHILGRADAPVTLTMYSDFL